MKCCILDRPGHIRVQDVPDPRPGAGDVVVRVRAALTCGTDLKTYRRGHPKMPCPTPFGHEFSGDVVEVGDRVERFARGQAVMSANTGPCLSCFYCRRGQENLCESIMAEMILGAFAEYVLIPERVLRSNVFAKPDDLPYEQAALLEPLSSVCFGLAGLERSQQGAGPAGLAGSSADDAASALVIGAGPIGLLWLVALRAAGVEDVVVAARRPARLRHAEGLGAAATASEGEDVAALVRERTAGRGADIVVECTGQPQVWEQAVGYARRGGSVVLYGGCPAGTTAALDTYRLHYDGVQVSSPFHFRPRDVAEARRLLGRRDIAWSRFITSHAGLDDVPAVFDTLGEDGGVKCAVLPHGS